MQRSVKFAIWFLDLWYMVTRRVEINGNARTREILLSSSEILGICNISVYKCLFSLRATQMRTSIIMYYTYVYTNPP